MPGPAPSSAFHAAQRVAPALLGGGGSCLSHLTDVETGAQRGPVTSFGPPAWLVVAAGLGLRCLVPGPLLSSTHRLPFPLPSEQITSGSCVTPSLQCRRTPCMQGPRTAWWLLSPRLGPGWPCGGAGMEREAPWQPLLLQSFPAEVSAAGRAADRVPWSRLPHALGAPSPQVLKHHSGRTFF